MYQKLGLPEVERTHLESKLPSVRTYREKEKWDERGTLLGVEQQRLELQIGPLELQSKGLQKERRSHQEKGRWKEWRSPLETRLLKERRSHQ